MLCCCLATFQLILKRTRLWYQFIFGNLKQTLWGRSDYLSWQDVSPYLPCVGYTVLPGQERIRDVSPYLPCVGYTVLPGQERISLWTVFCLWTDTLFLGKSLCSTLGEPWILTVLTHLAMWDTALGWAQQLQQHWLGWRIQQFEPWDDDAWGNFLCISDPQLWPWLLLHTD